MMDSISHDSCKAAADLLRRGGIAIGPAEQFSRIRRAQEQSDPGLEDDRYDF